MLANAACLEIPHVHIPIVDGIQFPMAPNNSTPAPNIQSYSTQCIHAQFGNTTL